MANFKFQITSACRKWTLALFSYFFIFLFSFTLTHAQVVATPDFFITWRSAAYTDSGYAGKVLPAPGAPLTVSTELLDGAKLADLSKTTIRWIRNGKLIQSGIGLKSVTLTPDPRGIEGAIRLKVVVVKYKGADLERNITIPVAAPEVVLRVPSPALTIRAGGQTLKALLYHWSATQPNDIRINWTFQNQRITASGADNAAALNIPESAVGTVIALSVSAQNLKNEFEIARDSRTVTVVAP